MKKEERTNGNMQPIIQAQEELDHEMDIGRAQLFPALAPVSPDTTGLSPYSANRHGLL